MRGTWCRPSNGPFTAMPFALGSVALGKWFVMNRCFTTHLTCPTSLLLTLYFQQVRAIIKGLACDYVQPNLGSIQKDATKKKKLSKGPYGSGTQTQFATSGWGRGFSKVAPHPNTCLSPPQARGHAVLIPSNAVGDAWVRRALLKVRVTTYYLLPTNHYSSHVLVLATYCMYWYLLPRVVSLSRLRCLRSSSCRSIITAYKCSSRTSTSL